MTREEAVQAGLAAEHAERVAARLEARGRQEGVVVLRIFAAALRAGAHIAPAGNQAEADLRAGLVAEDLLRQGRG
jgi:hypothetical protein